MKTVIIVSKCIKITRKDFSDKSFHFHFKGVFAGEIVKTISLKASNGSFITKGEEYLLYVRITSCSQGELKGDILKFKLLDECWDKS